MRPLTVLAGLAGFGFLVLLSSLCPQRTAASTTPTTTAELRQLALSSNDLPGFRQVAEDVPGGEGIMQATFGEQFVLLDATGQVTARVGVLLLAPFDMVDESRLQALVTDGELYAGVRDSPNFMLTSPLSVSGLDQPASWNNRNARTGAWSTTYAETFLDGRIVAHLIYEAPADSADPAFIVHLAQLQQQRLCDAGAADAFMGRQPWG
jgi:hypothetical protein